MKLKRMSLQNFKGLKDLTINFSNKTNILGDNATGKTTIYDAWLWLLFDKDSNNKKDFEIKPIKNSETVHNLETIVEAETEIDETEYILKKVFKEKWTKKRGEAQAAFTGHTTNYYINGVPKKKLEYQTAINNIISEDIFKTLSSVTYFNEHLSWQERRSILLSISGLESKDLEIAQDTPEFRSLIAIFKDYTTDDYKKMLLSTRKKLNEDIKSIPIRIDELTKGIDDNNINEDEQSIEEKLIALKRSRLGLQNIPISVEESPEKARIDELVKIVLEKEAQKEQKIRDLKKGVRDVYLMQDEFSGFAASINKITDKISELRQSWYNENEKTANTSGKCSCCGQSLPEDKIQESIEQFNLQKAEHLKKITDEGKKLAEQLTVLQHKKDEVRVEIDMATAIGMKVKEIANEPIAENDEITSLRASIIKGDTNRQVNPNNSKIDALTAQIETLEVALAKISAYKSTKNRISELEAKEKELALLFAENEDKINLLDKFITYKIGMIESSVNDKFSLVKFKLFNVQINGGIEETCETMIDGVPYKNLNSASTINAGLDVIKTLQTYYKKQVPVFVDNAESINDLLDMDDTQVIRLIVSRDKKLRIEED